MRRAEACGGIELQLRLLARVLSEAVDGMLVTEFGAALIKVYRELERDFTRLAEGRLDSIIAAAFRESGCLLHALMRCRACGGRGTSHGLHVATRLMAASEDCQSEASMTVFGRPWARLNAAGITSIDKSSAVIIPPTIGVAIRRITSDPVPLPHMIGRSPAMTTATVIATGRM